MKIEDKIKELKDKGKIDDKEELQFIILKQILAALKRNGR